MLDFFRSLNETIITSPDGKFTSPMNRLPVDNKFAMFYVNPTERACSYSGLLSIIPLTKYDTKFHSKCYLQCHHSFIEACRFDTKLFLDMYEFMAELRFNLSIITFTAHSADMANQYQICAPVLNHAENKRLFLSENSVL